MGVIAFGRPQEGLEQIKQALGMVELIRIIGTDPTMGKTIGKTIKELSAQLSEAQALSDEQQKRAADAQEMIAQASEAQDDLKQAQMEHATKVRVELDDLDKKYAAYQDALRTMADEKAASQKASDKVKSDAVLALAQARQLNDMAAARQAKAEAIEKETNAKLMAHQAALDDFEKVKAQLAADIAAAAAQNEAAANDLADRVQAFELRKKRVEEALRG